MLVANRWHAGWVSMGRRMCTREGLCPKGQLRRARLASLGTFGHEAMPNLEDGVRRRFSSALMIVRWNGTGRPRNMVPYIASIASAVATTQAFADTEPYEKSEIAAHSRL